MRVIIAASGILALALAASVVVRHQTNTPEYALEQIEKALSTRDSRLFDKHVDIESVIDRAVTDLLAVTPAATVIEHTRHASGAVSREQLRPALTTLTQGALLNAFVAGSDSVRASLRDDALGFAAITNHSSLNRAAFRDVIEIRQDGSSAFARILLEETDLDTALVLTLEMEKRDGTWMFVGMTDLADYVRAVGHLRMLRDSASEPVCETSCEYSEPAPSS